MSVLYVALPAAILLGAAAMVACVICIRRGQFDDLETPPVRMLIDERPAIGRCVTARGGNARDARGVSERNARVPVAAAESGSGAETGPTGEPDKPSCVTNSPPF